MLHGAMITSFMYIRTLKQTHMIWQDAATKAKLDALTQEIKQMQTEVETLGEQGEVEKAEEMNKKVLHVLHPRFW